MTDTTTNAPTTQEDLQAQLDAVTAERDELAAAANNAPTPQVEAEKGKTANGTVIHGPADAVKKTAAAGKRRGK